MNLKRTVKRKWGTDMTELTPSGGRPRTERLDLRATIENPINSGSKDRTGGAGVTTSLRGKS